jgi:hypothetical protein
VSRFDSHTVRLRGLHGSLQDALQHACEVEMEPPFLNCLIHYGYENMKCLVSCKDILMSTDGCWLLLLENTSVNPSEPMTDRGDHFQLTASVPVTISKPKFTSI